VNFVVAAFAVVVVVTVFAVVVEKSCFLVLVVMADLHVDLAAVDLAQRLIFVEELAVMVDQALQFVAVVYPADLSELASDFDWEEDVVQHLLLVVYVPEFVGNFFAMCHHLVPV
jgi:hypothetical protein